MPIYATNNAKLFIGGVLSDKSTDFTSSDFNAQSWIEVDHVEGLGSFGDTASEITFDAINRGRTQKLKGTLNAGNLEGVAGIDAADVGQIALRAAMKTPYDYAFKVQFNDAPNGGTPSQRMFIAKVMSTVEALDTANNVMKLNFSLAINSNIVEVAAAA